MNNEVTIVVGAGGLGTAVTKRLLESGEGVALVDISESNLERAIPDANNLKRYLVDRTDDEAVEELVEDIASQWRIKGLVHAVGINTRKPILETSVEDFDKIIEINLRNAFMWGKAVGRVLCSAEAGSIVFFSSVSERSAHANHGPYAASKGGIRQLSRVMAREWAHRNVRVNCVAPGYTETDLTAAYLKEDDNRLELESLVPMGRLGIPKDVAGAVEFLLGDNAQYITGQSIHIDGGRGLL